MIPGWRGQAIIAGITGLTGVALAALGSHVEGGIEDSSAYRAWLSASLMHVLHASAMLALAAWSRSSGSRLPGVAVLLMAVGVALFSGSIYWMVLGARAGTGGIAPVGGLCLMASWAAVLVIALVTERERA